MSGPSHPFDAGFMDDYYAEAEEHLVAARRVLLALEAGLGQAPQPLLIEELFRSFHTLKGISAMVELREAEVLAHQMEGCLRPPREGRAVVTASMVETLTEGARLLDRVVEAHRRGVPLPDIRAALDRLETLARSSGAEAASADEMSVAPALTRSGRVWKVTFTPSAALVTRGVKVDTIRERLLQIGQVLSVVPRVVAGGGVSFDFIVETEHDAQLAAWREDGIAYEPAGGGTSAAGLAARRAHAGDGRQDPGSRESAPGPAAAGGSHLVRVDLARLDELMRLVGDMVVARARLEDTLQRVERHVPFHEWRTLQEHSAGIERQLHDLREGVMRVRLVPVGEIFRRMPFVVRDLARDSGRRVRLELSGQSTEIDKFLIERMMDPVLHLVRNAVSHGIETPEERVGAGKPPEGTVGLTASTVGETVVLEIADDGRGIDTAAVARRARSLGVSLPDGDLDPRDLLDTLCTSGFSTREEADRASGRGVGMAVVRSTVEELGGAVALETTPGRGTTFRVTLPLTLAITDAIIVHVGPERFAVPQAAVREVIEVDAAAIRRLERNELLPHRGGTLPLVRLSEVFGIATEERPRFHALVAGTGPSAVGLLVDRIAGQREIVVKAVADPLIRVEGVSGVTELGDGRLVLILDVGAVSRLRRDRSPRAEERTA